jgi:hypothetical protein
LVRKSAVASHPYGADELLGAGDAPASDELQRSHAGRFVRRREMKADPFLDALPEGLIFSGLVKKHSRELKRTNPFKQLPTSPAF